MELENKQKGKTNKNSKGGIMKAKVEKIIEKYNSEQGYLVSMLQDVQKEFNYLPREALNVLSTRLDIPISHIYTIATFYKVFSFFPRGQHQLSLCTGTACHVRGALQILDHISRVLGLKPGETSSDLKFTFETVNCLGACALGPILVVDGKYHGQMTISKVNKILKELEKKVTADED